MGKRKKAFTLHFKLVEDRGPQIARDLARREIEKVLQKHGAVSYNLEEVLLKYIPDRPKEGAQF